MNPQQWLTAKGEKRKNSWVDGDSWSHPKPQWVNPKRKMDTRTRASDKESFRGPPLSDAGRRQEARLTARRQFR